MLGRLILVELERIGVEFEVVGDKIRYRPRSSVPPEIVVELKKHKEEIMYILTSHDPFARMGIEGPGHKYRKLSSDEVHENIKAQMQAYMLDDVIHLD